VDAVKDVVLAKGLEEAGSVGYFENGHTHFGEDEVDTGAAFTSSSSISALVMSSWPFAPRRKEEPAAKKHEATSTATRRWVEAFIPFGRCQRVA